MSADFSSASLGDVLPRDAARAAPGFPLLLPVAGLLIATCWLDQGLQCVAALAMVILLGVPHGALDGEIARPLLRPRFGWAWFPVFAVPYLGLVAGVLTLRRITLEGLAALTLPHMLLDGLSAALSRQATRPVR